MARGLRECDLTQHALSHMEWWPTERGSHECVLNNLQKKNCRSDLAITNTPLWHSGQGSSAWLWFLAYMRSRSLRQVSSNKCPFFQAITTVFIFQDFFLERKKRRGKKTKQDQNVIQVTMWCNQHGLNGVSCEMAVYRRLIRHKMNLTRIRLCLFGCLVELDASQKRPCTPILAWVTSQ